MNDFLNQGPYDPNQPGKFPKKNKDNNDSKEEDGSGKQQDWQRKWLDSFNSASASKSEGDEPSNDSNDNPDNGPTGYQRTDYRIREDISEALGANGTIDPSRILVHVEFGIVILSGIVDSEEERSLAMQLATSVAGVRHVENDLELSEEQRLWNIAQLN